MATSKHLTIKKVTPKVLEYIHSRFEYNPELGRLISKITTRNNRCGHKAGELVKGAVTMYGYREVFFGSYRMREHRLIFLMCHGILPKMLDHIDGNKLNNKIENLRVCNRSQNQFNSKVPKNNTTGFKGIVYLKARKKYLGNIAVSGKVYRTKQTKSLTEAVLLLRSLRENLHGEYYNHG